MKYKNFVIKRYKNGFGDNTWKFAVIHSPKNKIADVEAGFNSLSEVKKHIEEWKQKHQQALDPPAYFYSQEQ